jgi:hypothetical protein
VVRQFRRVALVIAVVVGVGWYVRGDKRETFDLQMHRDGGYLHHPSGFSIRHPELAYAPAAAQLFEAHVSDAVCESFADDTRTQMVCALPRHVGSRQALLTQVAELRHQLEASVTVTDETDWRDEHGTAHIAGPSIDLYVHTVDGGIALVVSRGPYAAWPHTFVRD